MIKDLFPPIPFCDFMILRIFQETEQRQLTPSDQMHDLYHMLACSVKSWRRKEERVGTCYDICLSKQLLHIMESCFPGNGKVVNQLFSLHCLHMLLLLLNIFTTTQMFLFFYLGVTSQVPQQRSE